MKCSMSWLKDYLKTDLTTEMLAQKLTDLGHEVEGIQDKSKVYTPFVAAKIMAAAPHPEAEKLQICQVDDGSGSLLQIVCGAPNARVGLVTILAPEGASIPSNKMTIKKSKLRGVESQGMLCSWRELDLGQEADGIAELDPSIAPGTKLLTVIPSLNESVLEVGLTPNRGDCASIRGIARDLAAAGCGTLLPLDVAPIKSGSACPVSLQSKALDDCPLFMGRVIRGIKNGPSPDFIQNHLKSLGLKPLSLVVDVTNYICLGLGRPLHAFDLHKIHGSELTVRYARDGESLDALNHQTYALDPSMVVVADEKGPLAIGGIIGGATSGCTADTVDIFLESAFFNPRSIAATGQRLGIITDSRYRFERGVDPASTALGLDLATRMIIEHGGGDASQIVQAGSMPVTPPPILFDPALVQRLTSVSIETRSIIHILESLGFDVKPEGACLRVTPPTWRFDVSLPEDLVEEVIRVHGYDQIPTLELTSDPLVPSENTRYQTRKAIKLALANCGLDEALTWSMVAEDDIALFGGQDPRLKILNPISQDLLWMRPSILPNLLKLVARHQDRSTAHGAFFELGPLFKDPTLKGEEQVATGVRFGDKAPLDWQQKNKPVDFYDVKRDLIQALDAVGIPDNKVQWTRDDIPEWYHPFKTACIRQGRTILGYVGELHPKILKAYKIKGPVMAFELFVDLLPLPKPTKGALVLSDLQPTVRDFAFILKPEVAAGDVQKVIQKSSGFIQTVTIYDVFTMPDGARSVTYRVRLMPQDTTFTESAIKTIYDIIIQDVQTKTGATFRL